MHAKSSDKVKHMKVCNMLHEKQLYIIKMVLADQLVQISLQNNC